MKRIFYLTSLLLATLFAFGEKEIKPGDKLVFVMYEKHIRNFILIPNVGKLHTFKIYRKLKSETEYKFMTELTKPALPMRDHFPSWSVSWEDPDFHSRDIDYKVMAFDKKGNELCEMVIIWEKENGATEGTYKVGTEKDSTTKSH